MNDLAITYHGACAASGRPCTVSVITAGRQAPLAPRDDLRSYSAQFDWGEKSPGAAQLALALCAHALAPDDARALAVHEAFRDKVIVGLADDRWVLTKAGVIGMVESLEKTGTPI